MDQQQSLQVVLVRMAFTPMVLELRRLRPRWAKTQTSKNLRRNNNNNNSLALYTLEKVFTKAVVMPEMAAIRMAQVEIRGNSTFWASFPPFWPAFAFAVS